MKHKRYVFPLILCLLICTFCVNAGAANYVQDTESDTLDAQQIDVFDVSLTWETAAYNQSDFDDRFQTYAQGNSQVILPQTYSRNDGANVVGVVLDETTREPVENAAISVNGTVLVYTDENGRFQIKNMPDGTYDWKVSKSGYQDSLYENYDVAWENRVDIFNFMLSQDAPISKDRIDILTPVTTIEPNNIQEHVATPLSFSGVPQVSSTVNVLGVGTGIGRQDYITAVVASELYAPSFYENPNYNTGRTKKMTESQVYQLYVAQAVASNAFLESAMKSYSNHNGTIYDVCATTCCQKYDPTKIHAMAISAAASLFNSRNNTTVMVYNEGGGRYSYIAALFFSDCNNQGTVSNSNPAAHPALQAVSCHDFDVGANGHRQGMCQMGAAQMAYEGYGNADIRSHYYTGNTLLLCKMVDRSSLNV